MNNKIIINESNLRAIIKNTLRNVINEAYYSMDSNGNSTVVRDNQYFGDSGKLKLQAEQAIANAERLYKAGRITGGQFQKTIDYWHAKLNPEVAKREEEYLAKMKQRQSAKPSQGGGGGYSNPMGWHNGRDAYGRTSAEDFWG